MAGRSNHRAFGDIETRRNVRTKKVTVAIAEDLVPILAEHIERFAQPGRNGLIFPGRKGAFCQRALGATTGSGRATRRVCQR